MAETAVSNEMSAAWVEPTIKDAASTAKPVTPNFRVRVVFFVFFFIFFVFFCRFSSVGFSRCLLKHARHKPGAIAYLRLLIRIRVMARHYPPNFFGKVLPAIFGWQIGR